MDELWDWCGLTSPGICPGLNLTDYSVSLLLTATCIYVSEFFLKPRDNAVTCVPQPIIITNTTNMIPTVGAVGPDDSPGGTIIQMPLVSFHILIMLTMLIVFYNYYTF